MDTYVLIEKINDLDKEAASALQKEDLISDADLQMLTQEDLRELLPGLKNVRRRRFISNIIHEQKPINVLIERLREFISNEAHSAALSPSGVLVDCLNVLKDLKSQMNQMQGLLDAHFKLLGEFSSSQPHQDQDKGASSSNSLESGPPKRRNSRTSNSPQTASGRGSRSSSTLLNSISFGLGPQQKTQATLAFKMVVSGKTFNAHKQLLDKVKASSGEPDLILVERDDGEVAIVFCPIVSRVGTDAEAALSKVTGCDTVILVLMHHTHAVKAVTSMNPWSNVVLCVNVFYHETVPGLLQCQDNNVAIAKIRQELMSHSVQTLESGKAENESKHWYSFNWKS